jgi:copper ion binding protein
VTSTDQPLRRFEVPGISCDHCKAAIEGAVGALTGIDSVDVDVASRIVVVAGTAADGDIVAAIDDAGYDVAGPAR